MSPERTHAATSPAPTSTVHAPPGRSPYVAASALVLGGFMVVVDVTITAVALKTLMAEFGAPLTSVQWVTSAYTLTLAAVIPLASWLMARFPTRVVYGAALTVFVLGSALVGMAPSLGALIAARVAQAAGGALIQPVGMATALRSVPPERRATMSAFMGLPVLFGTVLGPTLGGVLLDTWSWRAMFLVNVPVGVVALAWSLRVLPRTTAGVPRPLDLVGLGLLVPGTTAAVYGIERLGSDDDPWLPAALLALGVLLVVAFALRSARRRHPLVHTSLLRLRPMAVGTTAVMLFAGGYFGSVFVLPLYWQSVHGFSATTTGLLAIPQAVASGLTMQFASRRLERHGARVVVGSGIVTATVGVLVQGRALDSGWPPLVVVLASTLVGVGVGSTLMPLIAGSTRDLDPDDMPSGTTLITIGNQIAQSAGIAAVSTTLASTRSFADALGVTATVFALAFVVVVGLSPARRR